MIKALKIILVVIIIAALGAMVFIASSDVQVNLETSWTPPDYETEGTVVEGLSAYEVFTQALENYYNAENFIFMASFDFKAGLPPFVLATQQTIEITKYQNGKVFHQVTKQGTGLGKVNEGYRFYFDGENGYEINESSKDRFPALGTEDWSGLEYAAYENEEKTSAQEAENIVNFSRYVITPETLADTHNDKVYQMGGKYYLSLTVNCLGIETGTVQSVIEEAIIDGLGSNVVPGTLTWLQDSVLTLEITKISGQYYITARRLSEKYQAKQAGTGAVTSSEQYFSGTYAYTAGVSTITAEELMNLA
ncbi:MAG: hypothetical protein ACOYIQ_02190 [Christensenellales bacterium]|jgi:hypothetical protein